MQFQVEVTRVINQTRDFWVTAESKEEAKEIAIEKAQEFNWFNDEEFSVGTIWEV